MKSIVFLLVIAISGLFLSGCGTLEKKAVGVSNGIGGFKLEVAGSGANGSMPLPNIWLANDTFSYGSAPALDKDVKTQIVFTAVKRRSFFGSLFGVDDTSFSMTYIGDAGESAEDTAKRINALKSVVEEKE